MKRSTKLLTFAALMAASTLSVSGCIHPTPTEETEVDVYGPPPDSTIEQSIDIPESETSVTTEESKQEVTEPTDTSLGPHEHEVCVYGPPPRATED